MTNAIIGAVLIGLCLSVFGSGGSILTVPVLLYLVGMPADLAIASSLLIVGAISLFNSSFFIRRGEVSWKHVWLFGVPGMAGTYLGAWLGGMVKSSIQLLVFVILMLVASVMMWRSKVTLRAQNGIKTGRIVAEGLTVGAITGFVGVGGGFLIVPALVLLGGLSMTLAVGSSLLIIAMKSMVGFFKYYSDMAAEGIQFDWPVIGIMALGGIVGGLAGNWINKRIDKSKLQKGFAVFLVIMAGFVLVKSVI